MRPAGDCTRPLLFRRTTLVGELLWRIVVNCSLGPACSMDFDCNPLRQPDSGCLRYFRDLPDEPPAATPLTAWDDWRNAVRDEVVPEFVSWFGYELSGVQLLPAIHPLAKLSAPGRRALSDLVLASLVQWEAGWQSATITKVAGADWRTTHHVAAEVLVDDIPMAHGWIRRRAAPPPLACAGISPPGSTGTVRTPRSVVPGTCARRLNAEPQFAAHRPQTLA